ncbi:helix-turn-helix domain-containing protein [Brevibacterium sp. HMSC07C04]
MERSRRNPTLDIIFKLAHGLDVSPAELLATTN